MGFTFYHKFDMPIITFDIPPTSSQALNTIPQGGFLRINGQANVRSSGTGTSIDTTDLTTGITTSRPSATMVEPMTLLSASFAVTPA
tara:strand:+ start:2447 stop:2707 length:261 start_codon:yes stop_codon:yes gene_type:complete